MENLPLCLRNIKNKSFSIRQTQLPFYIATATYFGRLQA